MEFSALLVTLGALALTVEKVVSGVRHIIDASGKFPTVVWNILALAVGIGFALGWQLNLAPAIVGLIPAVKDSGALEGTSGQLLTGLAIGAASGFFYGVLQALEATVHRNA